jgi:molybdopterin-guanine dinucleotide biosynthesis protein A
VILAGGQSSRFGADKALLPLGGQPLLARTVAALAALTADLIVVTNDPAAHGALGLPARLVPDVEPGRGPLMGIYSGLQAARHDYAFVVACDMPLLSLPLMRHMATLVAGYDVVIPYLDGLFEPLHAIYARSCLPAMAHVLDRGGRQIIAFFPDVRVRRVGQETVDRFDPQGLSFVNVNTEADWDRVQRLLDTP